MSAHRGGSKSREVGARINRQTREGEPRERVRLNDEA